MWGTSRVYRLAEGELVQLTVDHSEAEELVAAGKLTREEARRYRRRNVVTRSLGIEPGREDRLLGLPHCLRRTVSGLLRWTDSRRA